VIGVRMPVQLHATLHRLGAEARGWGLGGVALAVLLALALTFALWIVPALESARDEARADAAAWQQRLTAQRRAAAAPSAVRNAADFAVRNAADFAARLPAAPLRSARLAALLADAERQGLVVQRAELREVALPALPELVQLRVVLPVVGTAPAVWAWAGQALERDPALALLRMRLERAGGAPQDRARSRVVAESSAAAQAPGTVRAELEFALYAQSSSSAPP
jgi:hypothetical protein